MKTIKLLVTICVFVFLFFSCEKNDEPKIIDCNSVKYEGYKYVDIGCNQPGIATEDITVTQNGHTASFFITCSDGCISSVIAQ
jgi:hypothetical protein